MRGSAILNTAIMVSELLHAILMYYFTDYQPLIFMCNVLFVVFPIILVLTDLLSIFHYYRTHIKVIMLLLTFTFLTLNTLSKKFLYTEQKIKSIASF